MPDRTCSLAECDRKVKARGYCNAHYLRDVRHGDPRAGAAIPTPDERFWSKVDKTATCWLWRASRTASGGYGQISVKGRPVRAHVYAYRTLVGEVPAGLVLDHTCHQPACVNPAHLRPVTRKQNNENHNGGPLSTNRTSGVRGVSWSKAVNKWEARVTGRVIGYFDSITEAEAAAIEQRNATFTHNDLDRV